MDNVLSSLAKQSKVPVDSIPAQLTHNEYVIPADVVLAVGNGDPKEGAKFFDDLVAKVRSKTHGKIQSTLAQAQASQQG